MAKKNVLITGGSGFIGSHLCDRFLLDGYDVWAVDNFVTGSPKNMEHLQGNTAFHFRKYDVSETWENLFTGDFQLSPSARFDVVLHFACPASPVDFGRIPLEILKVDSLGTFHALELAKAHGARFLLASTSEVYGDPLVHPQTEDYCGNVNPIGHRSMYDEAKRFSEAATMVYHRKYGVNTAIVRIFNTYGPRMRLDDGRVVPNFCGQALRNEPITVYGDGSQTRSFCYVSDLVEGIFKLVHSKEHTPVNVGNPGEYRIIDFATKVIEAVAGTTSKVIHKPLLFEDDPKQRRPDITKAKNILGWQPKVDLAEGIQHTLKYFRQFM